MPYYIELPDGVLVEVPDDVKPDDARKLVIGKYAGSHGVPASAAQAGSNKTAALVRGGAGIAGIIPGVAGFITGDYENAPLAKTVEGWKQKANEMESPELAYKKKLMDRAIQEAGKGGLAPEAWETLKQLVTNPQITGLKMLELIPDIAASIGTGGVGALAAKQAVKYTTKEATEAAAKKAASEAASKYGTRAAIGQAAVSEGAGTGLDTFEEVYRLELAKGTPKEEAAQIAASRARMAQAASTGISALTAAALPGIEKAAFRARPAGVLRTAAGESGQEMIEGGTSQFAQNVAANASDESIGLGRNLGRTVTEGGFLGALAGGASAVPSSFRRPETAPAAPPAPPAPPAAETETPPAPPAPETPPAAATTTTTPPTAPAKNTVVGRKAEYEARLEELSLDANESNKAEITELTKSLEEAKSHPALSAISKRIKVLQQQQEQQATAEAVSQAARKDVEKTVVEAATNDPDAQNTAAAIEQTAAAAKKKADDDAAAAATAATTATQDQGGTDDAVNIGGSPASVSVVGSTAGDTGTGEADVSTPSGVDANTDNAPRVEEPAGESTATLTEEKKAAPKAVAPKKVRTAPKKAAPVKEVKEETEEEEGREVKALTDEELKTYRLPTTTPTAQSQQVSKGLEKLNKRIGANLNLTPRVDLDYGRATAKINSVLTKPGAKRTPEERAMHAYVKGVQSINPQAKIEDVFRYLAHDLADADTEAGTQAAQAAREYVQKALGKDALKKLDATTAEVKKNVEAAVEDTGRLTSSAGRRAYEGKRPERTGTKKLKDRLAQIISGESEPLTKRERATEARYAKIKYEFDPRQRDLKSLIAERLHDLISDENPTQLVFADLKKEGVPAKFDPATNTITIDPKFYSDDLLLHEAAHAFIDHVIDNPKSLNEKQKVALARLKNLFELVPQDKKEEFGATTLKEFAAQALSDPEFQRYLRNTRVPIRPFSFFTEFTNAVIKLLGLDRSGSAFTEAVDVIDQLLSAPTVSRKGKEVSYAPGDRYGLTSPSGETIVVGTAPTAPTAQTTAQGTRNRQERERREANLVTLQTRNKLSKALSKMLGRLGNWGDYNFLVRTFENERRPISTIQEGIVSRGALVLDGENANAVSTHLDQAASRSSALYNEEVSPTVKKLDSAIAEFARLTNVKVEEAMERLNKYFIALHEPERRQAVFYRKVREYLDTNGQSEHQRIFEKLYDEMDQPLPAADIASLRTDLDNIIQNDPKLTQKLQDDGLTLEQFRDSDIFDVVGIKTDLIGANGRPTGETAEVPMSSAMQKQFADSFVNVPEDVKASLEQIRTHNRELNKIILDLDKRGRYAGPQVQNIVKFYDFKDYVPFRGLEKDEDADVVDPRSRRMGGELAQSEQSMEGRVTEPENVLARNRVQAVRAAQRPARYDLTRSIKNAVKEGYIAGPPEAKKITFKERIKEEGRDKLPKAGENVVYHYDDGGNVYVVKIDNPIVSRALRQVYVDSNPLVKGLNFLTRPIAKGFTFYNPGFWLTNFVSDVFTNATVFAAEDAKGMQFLRNVATDIVKNKLFAKTVNFVRLYNQGTEESWNKLRALAERDEYYARALEFVGKNAGGKTEYVSGFSTDTQMQQLLKNLNPGRIRKVTGSVNGFFAVAADTFELTSRLAAYKTYRDTGLTVIEAANKTKNLANFEHVGELGRGLGAWFMFFRQSATGAVRALDALAKGKYGPQTAMTMASVGFMAYMFAALISGDDEEGNNRVFNDDPDRWTRNARFFFPGVEDPIQMRWGFGINGFAAAGAQMASLIFGRSTISQFAENTFKDILTENLLPLPLSKMNMFADPTAWLMDTIAPAPVKPFAQLSANRDALDRAIVSSTRGGQRFQDPYAYNQNVPAWIRDTTAAISDATLGEIAISPNVANFMLSNYLGAVHKFLEAGDNVVRSVTGDQEFDLAKTTMLFRGFSGTAANVDISDYYKMRDEMERHQRIYKSLERRGTDALDDYEDKYGDRIDAFKYFIKANNSVINPILKQRNELIADTTLSSQERKAEIKLLMQEQKEAMREIMEETRSILGRD